MDEENKKASITSAAEETPIRKYCSRQNQVRDTIHFLELIGGRDLNFNPYKDAIHRLQGVYEGMRMADDILDL